MTLAYLVLQWLAQQNQRDYMHSVWDVGRDWQKAKKTAWYWTLWISQICHWLASLLWLGFHEN